MHEYTPVRVASLAHAAAKRTAQPPLTHQQRRDIARAAINHGIRSGAATSAEALPSLGAEAIMRHSRHRCETSSAAMMRLPHLHTYQATQLAELARTAARRSWQVPLGYDQRKVVAYRAITQQLRDAQDRPEPETLLRAAVGAIRRAGQAEAIPMPDELAALASPAVGLAPRGDESEQQLVDLIALGQAWAQLSSTHQRVLSAHAQYGSVGSAAIAIGLTRSQMDARLLSARARLWWLWTRS